MIAVRQDSQSGPSAASRSLRPRAELSAVGRGGAAETDRRDTLILRGWIIHQAVLYEDLLRTISAAPRGGR